MTDLQSSIASKSPGSATHPCGCERNRSSQRSCRMTRTVHHILALLILLQRSALALAFTSYEYSPARSRVSSTLNTRHSRHFRRHQQKGEQQISDESTKGDSLGTKATLSRRGALLVGSAFLSIPATPIVAAASVGTSTTTFLKGTAVLAAGLSTDEIQGAALYVTARPNRPDNVPRAILDGSRGKAPPVLSARFAEPSFPFEFSLTSDNFTPEGASIVDGMESSNTPWWEGEDLVVSARFDSDGVAATRDPTDLVGRAIYESKKGSDNRLMIELQGRGLFGKSVTSKK